MIKDNKHFFIAFIAIWIIILTCIATNTFYLRNFVLNYSTIPIIIVVLLAMLRVRRASGKNHG